MFFLDLKPHIKRELQVLQPINLMYAIDFAKLEEEKYWKFINIKYHPLQPTLTYIFNLLLYPLLPHSNHCYLNQLIIPIKNYRLMNYKNEEKRIFVTSKTKDSCQNISVKTSTFFFIIMKMTLTTQTHIPSINFWPGT